MSGKSSGKQTQESQPWKGAIPFLVGTNVDERGRVRNNDLQNLGAIQGLLPLTQEFFKNSSINPTESRLIQDYFGSLAARGEGNNSILQGAAEVAGGQYNFSPTAPGTIVGKDVSAGNITPLDVYLPAARASQGVLDPTRTMQQLLSGNVNSAVLDPQADAIRGNVARLYTENILPSISSNFIANGQFGSSRQGIAEGLAASRANQDLATALAPLYGQAFENAQNRSFSTANALNQQAADVMTGNVNRDFAGQTQNVGNRLNADLANQANALQVQQANSQNTLALNQQQQNAMNSNVANRIQGLNAYGQGLNFQDLNFQQALGLAGMERQRNMENLDLLNSIIQGAGRQGGITTGTASGGRNPIASGIGGALSGAALGAMEGTMFGPGIGTAVGGVLGLLSGFM